MEEKRRFVRIEWPVLVHYKTLEDPATEDQIVAKAVSEGGVSFTVYEKLTKGTKLDMQIQVPFDSMPMFVKAKVVWIKKSAEELGKVFEVGVEFLEVDPRDQKRLKLYINNEIQSRKKP